MSDISSYQEWKSKKQERGEWLPYQEYLRQKDLRRKKELERELDEINKRLHPRSHKELEEDFESFYQMELGKLKGKRSRSESDMEEGPVREGKRRRVSVLVDREVILDTETTGLGNSDRIVEISLLETISGKKTGRHLHFFLNPETKISKKAEMIHRITNERVKDCPVFKKVAEEIIKFIGSSNIVAHNASFDRRMLNNELLRAGWEEYEETRFIDTLEIARYLFPGERCNQNALCEKFQLDNHNRMKTGIHSAIEDTALLYKIYLQMREMLEKKSLKPTDFKLKHSCRTD